MARSGTSALTRVLSLCGSTLPAGMCGADANNPRGYWEPRTAIMLNETIMRRHGSNWYDPTLRLQEECAFGADEKAAWIAEIAAYLGTLPAAPLVVIKEPRITALSGLWFEAARQVGFDIAAVIAVRHPQEVVASAAKYVDTSPELSSALWLKYNLLAERHTRGIPRVFVDYGNLLDDWHREVKRVAAALEIDLDTVDESAVEEFLTPELRRQRYGGPVTDHFGADWVSAVYEALHGAAQDNPLHAATLDRVFESYQAGERDFRMAFTEFHARTNSLLRRVFRPFIVKRILEIAAVVHRHRGAWA
ncbi:sulfotransferase family protein [Mycobacterium intracellulare]|uniref:sulfotransferase family protein n=1 Tax=Mycobacterium intracellulare TaxID=1767 RepID=UPI0019158DE2|nr:sulfotransferase family protein [Mycobacterium intracellulare]MCA2357463.1 sulfotransferase family protein [Mycobacterium intracellulare]MCA2367537.1 sulfotransferase family protein [Mycobacterium intracellulare]